MRLIDADKININMALPGAGEFSCKARRAVQDLIAAQPTVDAVPVVHGHWNYDKGSDSVQCYACKNWITFGTGQLEDIDVVVDYEMNYCQYCGAKMDEVKTDAK